MCFWVGEDVALREVLPQAQDLDVLAFAARARFGLDPVRDIQVLCQMNRGGVDARPLHVDL